MSQNIFSKLDSLAFFILGIAFQGLFIQQSIANTEPETDTSKIVTIEKFNLPGRGQLALHVPANWEFTYVLASEDQPPIITFYTLDNHGQEVFQFNLSSLWDDGYKRNVTEPDAVKSFVESIGNRLLASSLETELRLIPVSGEAGSGYFFKLSDDTAEQEDYQHLMQGAYAMGDILLVFSLFTQEKDTHVHDAALQMISTARQIFQNNVHHTETVTFVQSILN